MRGDSVKVLDVRGGQHGLGSAWPGRRRVRPAIIGPMIAVAALSILSACGSQSPRALAVAANSSTSTAGGTTSSTSPAPSTTTTSTSVPTVPATWTSRSLPGGVGSLTDVVCPSETQCFAVGSAEIGGPGWIIASSDGGDTWTLVDSTPEGQAFNAIACPTETRCVAVGYLDPGND